MLYGHQDYCLKKSTGNNPSLNIPTRQDLYNSFSSFHNIVTPFEEDIIPLYLLLIFKQSVQGYLFNEDKRTIERRYNVI